MTRSWTLLQVTALPLTELEVALRERPDHEPSWRAYAQVLVDRGDERGELLLMEQRSFEAELGEELREELAEVRRDLSADVEERLLADWTPRAPAHFEWRAGFLTTATLSGSHTIESLGALLELPAARLLATVRLMGLDASELPALEQVMSRWPLRTLELRSPGSLLAPADAPQAGLGDAGVETLARSTSLGSLDALVLVSQGLSPAGLLSLVRAPGLSRLRRLRVAEQVPGFGELRANGATWALASLAALELPECHLGDAAARELCALLPPSLRALDLRENAITDAGLAALASSGKLAALEELDLRHNALVDPDAAAADLKQRLPALRALSLAQRS